MNQVHSKKVRVAEFAPCKFIKEATLEEHGCVAVKPSDYTGEQFTYCFSSELFAISDIDIEASRAMQVRTGLKIDEEVISRYRVGVQKGNMFPAVALFKQENGKWALGDGQHTVESHMKEGVTHLKGVYMYNHPNPYMVATTFNCKGGHEEKLEAIIEKAGICYLNLTREAERTGTPGPTQSEIASKFQVTQSQINRYVHSIKVQELLAEKGMRLSGIKDKGTFEKLHTVMCQDENACLEIAQIASDFKLPLEQVKKIVKDWKSPSKSAVEKSKYLENQRKIFKVRTNNGTSHIGKKVQRSPEQVLKEKIMNVHGRTMSVDRIKMSNMMGDPQFSDCVDELIKYFKSLKK